MRIKTREDLIRVAQHLSITGLKPPENFYYVVAFQPKEYHDLMMELNEHAYGFWRGPIDRFIHLDIHGVRFMLVEEKIIPTEEHGMHKPMSWLTHGNEGVKTEDYG